MAVNGIDSFEQNKEKYHLTAAVSDGINSFPLLFENILLFTYSNEMNKLYTEGYIEYEDKQGTIDRIVERQVAYCSIRFEHDSQKADGDIAPKMIDQSIDLKFLINNIEILSNVPGMVTYRLHLISENYLNLNRNVNYTNYNDSKTSVTEIIKDILENNAEIKTTNTFELSKSNVNIDYISQEDDNSFSAIKYLMNKMYYSPLFGNEESIKSLIYDENSNTISLFDMKKGSPRMGVFPPVVVQVFKNDTNIGFDTPTNIGYTCRSEKINGVLNAKTTNVYSYDIESNSISPQKFENKSILNYYNGDKNGNPKMFYLLDETKFKDQQMEWNNNTDIYGNMFDALAKSNGLIVNQYGNIGTIPGYEVEVTIPNNFPPPSDTTRDNEFERMKYQSYTGGWTVFKVEHYINPKKKMFRQKLVLMRNQAQY